MSTYNQYLSSTTDLQFDNYDQEDFDIDNFNENNFTHIIGSEIDSLVFK